MGAPVEIVAEWVNKGVAPCLPGGFVTWSLVDAAGNVCWSFTDESFDVRTLPPWEAERPHEPPREGVRSHEPLREGVCSHEPLREGVCSREPQRVVSRGRFGFTAPIPPWNDQVLADLRSRGRLAEESFDLLSPGEYVLCVSVGTRQGTPKIALPLAGGHARRYPLGKVTVRSGK